MSACSPSGQRKCAFKDTFINRLTFGQKELVCVAGTTTLEDVLTLFAEKKITSCPVRDVDAALTGHGHAFIGIIDVFSIVRYVALSILFLFLFFFLLIYSLFLVFSRFFLLFTRYTCLDPVQESSAKSRGSIEGVIARESTLFKKTVCDLMNSTFVAKVPLYVFDGMDHVCDLLKVFAQPHRSGGAGCHRAFVVPAHTVSTTPGEHRMQIVTKSDVVDYVASNFDDCASTFAEKSIEELGLIHAADWVVTVPADVSAFEAFSKMAAEGVNCLAAVDADGTLVAHVGASDVRGITSTCVNRFFDPLVEFVGGADRMPVVSFDSKANYKNVVLEFASKRIHHGWIVDEQNRPVGVITLSDLLSIFM
jgi:CBS domain-containing protein